MVAHTLTLCQVVEDSSPGAKAAKGPSVNPSNGDTSPARALAKVEDKVCPPTMEEVLPTLYHLRLRDKFQWWLQHCQDKAVLDIISTGVSPTWSSPPRLPLMPMQKGLDNQEAALQILSDYLAIGAVKQVPLSTARFLVPWFVIKKQEG